MNEPTQQPEPTTPLNPYLDPKRFPLTTQEDLGLHDQRMIDAVNTDAINEVREIGTPLSPTHQPIAN